MKYLLGLFVFAAISVKADTFGDWVYDVYEGQAQITGLTAPALAGLNGEVIFPSEVNGIPVRGIGGYGPPGNLFGDRGPSLTNVIIPNGVTRIGPYALGGCSSLTNLFLPNGLKYIEPNAFASSGLISLSIPYGVEIIDMGVFAGCTNLTSITIPASVKSIEASAFSYCTNLASVSIPDGVTRIEYDAFRYCAALTSVSIPNTVTNIGNSAFYGCVNLTNLHMPSRFIAQIGNIVDGEFSTTYLLNQLAINPEFIAAVATNDAFVTAVANKILAASNNYGLATKVGVSNTITTLATKTELTNALVQSRTDGINSVISNPNLWTLYTTNQIHAMALGNLMLTRTNNGQFVLNYDIEQSDDLANWSPYQGFALPLTNLPTDKAFVRIKMKNQQ